MEAKERKKIVKTKRLPKSVYYRRRIIALLALVVIIALLALGIRYIISFSSALIESTKAPKVVKTNTEQVQGPTVCKIKDLEIAITRLKNNSVDTGSEVPITVVLKNKKPGQACLFEASQKLLGVVITTGETIIWDSSTCTKNKQQIPLLLGSKMEYATEIIWDGRAYNQCKPAKFAEPGTYLITATLDGKKTESVASMVIIPRTSTGGE